MKTKKLLLLSFLTIMMLFAVYAATDITIIDIVTPATADNVSGVIVLNATTDNHADNVTFSWINSSNVTVSTVTVLNNTGNDTIFNTTFNTSSISDGIYTLQANATNLSLIVTNSSVNITVDNTAPSVTSINSPSNNANLSTAIQVFNATVTDATIGVDSVLFNVSNGSSFYILNGTNNAGDFWNSSLNISLLDEGYQNVTVIANDSLNNINNSETINFTVDRTAPVVSLVNSSLNTTDSTPSIVFNFTDNLFSTASCTLYFNNTAYRTNSAVSNATDTTLTASSSISNGFYAVNVTCTDGSNNNGTSSIINITIAATTSSSNGGGGSSNTIRSSKTMAITLSETTEEYEVVKGDKLTFSYGSEDHSITINEIDDEENEVTLTISSITQKIKLGLLEDDRIDLDLDGINDIFVRLLTVSNGKAEISVKELDQDLEILAKSSERSNTQTGASSDSTNSQNTNANSADDETNDEKSSFSGISEGGELKRGASKATWIILVVILIAGLAGYFFYNSRQN